MAYLLADANGNWTAAATWKVANSTGLLDSQANTTALTTAFVSSSAFTPGAITIEGIAVKVATRAATPVGTMTVRLATGGVAVAGTTVTINVSDLPVNPVSAGATAIGCSVGWVYFKFGAPVTLVAATSYTVQATTSSSSQVSLFRDATAANWSRLLITSTTQAPAAGDSMFIVGHWTSAGSVSARTVTMNETANTDYGGASTSLASLGIGKGGTLRWGTAAATAYLLRLSGILQVWAEGVYEQGTSATPVPSGSSATIEFDSAADGDFGFVIFGTYSFAGSPRTAGKNVVQALLTADLAAAGTSLTIDTDTGWLNGDRIGLGTTTRTMTQSEEATLSADAGASSLTISAGVTNAHSGTSPTQGEVVLLTRNVTVRAVTTTATWIFQDYAAAAASAATFLWASFEYFGGTASSQVKWQLVTAAAVRTHEFCVFYRFERSYGLSASTTTLTFTDCIVWYNEIGSSIQFLDTAQTLLTITRGVYCFFGASLASRGINYGGAFEAIITDVRFVGFSLTWSGGTFSATRARLLMQGCNSHATLSSSLNLAFTGSFYITIRNSRFWRGAEIQIGTGSQVGDTLFESCYFIGNQSRHVFISSSWGPARMRVVDCDFESEASFTTSSGVVFNAPNFQTRLELHKCRFSQGATKHSVDINNNGTPLNVMVGLYVINCLLGAATKISTNITNGPIGDGVIAFIEEDGISGAHKSTYQHGRVQNQAPIFRTAAPSEELLPTSASIAQKLRSSPVFKPCPQGQAITFSVWVRKTAGYNGNPVRLVVEANGSMGHTDGVLATSSAPADTWEELTGTLAVADEDGVATAYVDCDGSAGSVYVDDWSATVA